MNDRSTDTEQTESLWRRLERIEATHTRSSALGPRFMIAEMLRAVADHLEARGEKHLDLDPVESAEWLLEEADRAERGIAPSITKDKL